MNALSSFGSVLGHAGLLIDLGLISYTMYAMVGAYHDIKYAYHDIQTFHKRSLSCLLMPW